MGEVRKELRAVLEVWHGRWHGAIRKVATEIEKQIGRDVYRRLLRELEGRPTWQVVEWLVEHCAPAEAPTTWRQDKLEQLAALWHQERESPPPGYAGRIVINGEVVRDALRSSSAANDTLTRNRLLEWEREEAEQAAQAYRRQLRELDEELIEVTSQRNVAQTELGQVQSRFARNVQTLLDQLEALRVEEAASEVRLAELRRRNDELQVREDQVRRERDDARDLADERYRQLELVRREADEEQRRIRIQIAELDQQNARLRAALDQEITSIRTAIRDVAAGTESPATATAQMAILVEEVRELLRSWPGAVEVRGDRQPPQTPQGISGREWMEDDDWLRPPEAPGPADR